MTEPAANDIGDSDLRRILVALDSSRESLDALEAAARVAARMQAELTGLFVEDIDLINLAALPFAREIALSGSGGRKLSPESVEKAWKSQAAAARQALENAARQASLRWSFRVTRGRVEAEVMAACGEADLVALGKAIRPLTRRARLGSTARAVTAGAPSAVLLAGGPAPASHSSRVMVSYDGSACARRALALAIRMARNDGGDLAVFLLPGARDRDALQQEVVARTADQGLTLSFRAVAPADLAAAFHLEHGGLLVLGADCLPVDADALAGLVEAANCPVLLIRPS
jgi:nucleotide-binding universal stress UspA family protein